MTRDPSEAFTWYGQSSRQGHRAAQTNVGWLYEVGEGVEQDYREAVNWSVAAAGGAPRLRAILQDSIQRVKPVRAIRTRLFSGIPGRRSRGLRTPSANSALPMLREFPTWTRTRWPSGLAEPLRKVTRGRSISWGSCITTAWASFMTSKKAVGYIGEAAEQGYAQALCRLGLMYERGDGVPQDFTQAVEFYGRAADDAFAEGWYRLALMYQEGKGVQQDYEKAARLLLEAARSHLPAMHEIGRCYFKGEGVPQDYEEAIQWFSYAADRDFPISQFSLGLVRQRLGSGTGWRQSLGWFQKAADQDYPDASHRLGCLYRDALGVPRDYARARELFRNAAHQGHTEAQLDLGLL